MSKQMTAQDFRDKRIKLENQITRLSADLRSRFLTLCKANPNVVLYQFLDAVLTAKMINEDILNGVKDDEVLEFMEIIEKYLERKNPRRQLELNLETPTS